MLAKTPPMGWNTWNTFREEISEKLIMEIADTMVEKGYKDAGYEYVVIDDCWAEKQRDENGLLVPDSKRFPNGMKYLSDYIHSKGLKFGIYSCAGVRTCADYPSSYGHEFTDAKTFAEWGVDFLKYDFCNFPVSGNCKNAYLTMGNALTATGRDILYSLCNWGKHEPWDWARSVGAHMYRTTGDICDSYYSMRDIAVSQIDKLQMSAPYCFNDLDMLTVGIFNKNNACMPWEEKYISKHKVSNEMEYETQFALWCMFSSPLMIGADIRDIDEFSHKLLTNKEIIAINQDIEARTPYLVNRTLSDKEDENLDWCYCFMKKLSNNEYAVLLWNITDDECHAYASYVDMGFPYSSGLKLEFKELLGDSETTYGCDYLSTRLKPHQCKLLKFKVK